MNWRVDRYDLPLSNPFGISRETSETSETVVVELTREETTGIGAVTPSAYYNESAASVAETLPSLCEVVDRIGDPHAQQRIEQELDEQAPDQPAARMALSIAVHDLAARQLNLPLYRRWGLDPDAVPPTTYTVGIDSPERMAEKASGAAASGFGHLKVKLGTDDDRARLDAVRDAVPDAEIRVDANAAWTVQEAIDKADWLADAGVTMLEQPVEADDIDGLRRVTDATGIPVAADESCVTASDVPRVADACDIVNAKLVKCGGLRPAMRLLNAATAHDLDLMLGCMVESNASIAAAAHLAPLVDYVDLDGALLLASDPYSGVPLEGDVFDLTGMSAGTGTRRTRDA
ncbi:L-alanine-DL-glutamate epimerase [Haloarcula vallismortis]|uniref:Chloromuconate cycloisomerase n=2 Tax=Haloarcula vallismortis TaxID=28442 RepID=M0IWC3_HALVA|nr:dipeptide epimerase [Haloarcula vallismortis]EMA01006.1 chloromuconate cycloisomerase [Haloarcula vallismortis ATCC 29715]SDW12537.1 L-alanine-DL-glutamate epimerase [Haloarcula vallismortis]